MMRNKWKFQHQKNWTLNIAVRIFPSSNIFDAVIVRTEKKLKKSSWISQKWHECLRRFIWHKYPPNENQLISFFQNLCYLFFAIFVLAEKQQWITVNDIKLCNLYGTNGQKLGTKDWYEKIFKIREYWCEVWSW